MQLLGLATTALSALAALPIAGALSAADWRKQSIYQVLTDRFARTDLSTSAACDPSQGVYCGGTWQGLVKKLDYIQSMGFTAIWISPVVKQVEGNTGDGSSYHGYWAQDIWSLNSHFGSADDLKALSTALHARGMYLMVDVVANHMGYIGCRSCVDYSTLNPFNSASYFHSPCTIDYNNQSSIETCWEGDDIVSLPDLRTEDSSVRSIWNSWINQLVSTYGIDGLRIDSAKHQEQSFWPDFQNAAGVFSLGEVYHGDPAYVGPYQNYLPGLLDYPSYYWITQAFQSTSGSISNLANGLNQLKTLTKDTTLYGSFIENHDQKRFPALTGDAALIKNAIAFMVMKDGIPIIYQGQEQGFAGGDNPANREALWTSGYGTSSQYHSWIASLNQIRNQAIYQDAGFVTSVASVASTSDHVIALRKGNAGAQIVSVFTNVGSSSSASVTLAASSTGFTANQQLIDVTTCTSYSTDSTGSLAVTLNGGLPRVFYPSARLQGSAICTNTTVPPTCSSAAITFNELVTTVYGDAIKIVGSIDALGSWDTSKAIALNSTQYTSSNPLWSVTLTFTPGVSFDYKFIKVSSSGAITWESDPNRSYTVPCSAATVSSSWR
ncbi:glycoside hydrolase family 13 protein [Thozetella sp. PMI_491]|nr:glycoside hydrolase family 13 protein [Thozetella sp. PMI_491]